MERTERDRREKLQPDDCLGNAQSCTPGMPSPRERLMTQIDNAQSSLVWKLNQYQELRDRVRFASDSELSLMAAYIDKLFLFNS